VVAYLELNPHTEENGSGIENEPSNSASEEFDTLKIDLKIE
jgi:hypothetical protein